MCCADGASAWKIFLAQVIRNIPQYFELIGCNHFCGRWPKPSGPGLKYPQLIPNVYRSSKREEEAEQQEQGLDPLVRQQKRVKRETEKGALWHEYDLLAHQYIAHLRRVHHSNCDIMMEVSGKGKVLVKAANPLAEPGIPLYYVHRKTAMYNDIFFHFWDTVMAPAFNYICPWFTVNSQKSLDKLFALEFERLVSTPCLFV